MPRLRVASWKDAPALDREIARKLCIGAIAEWLFFAAILAVFPLMMSLKTGIWFYVAGLAAIVLAIGVRINLDVWRDRLKQTRQNALMNEPEAELDHYPASIDVARGSLVTGTDRGWIWFEDGAMCFLGELTSFALSRDLVDMPKVSVLDHPIRPFQRRLCIPLQSGYAVQIDLKHSRNLGHEHLRERLLTLKRTSDLRQHPPTDRGPGAFSRLLLAKLMVLRAIGMIGLAGLPAVLSLVLAVMVDGRAAWGIMPAILLTPCWDGWRSIRHAVRSWRLLGATPEAV